MRTVWHGVREDAPTNRMKLEVQTRILASTTDWPSTDVRARLSQTVLGQQREVHTQHSGARPAPTACAETSTASEPRALEAGTVGRGHVSESL